MKRSHASGILPLAFALAFWCNGARAEDLTTASGKVFKNIEIRELNSDSITVNHSGGVTKIPLNDLPSEIQKRFSAIELFKELRRTTGELERLRTELAATRREKAKLAQTGELSGRLAAEVNNAGGQHTAIPFPPITGLPQLQASDVVDADEITHHYKTDFRSADLRYKKKVFRVRGKIERFEEKPFVRKISVVFESAERFQRVVCELPFPDEFNALYSTKGGQVLVGIANSRREVRLMEVGETVVLTGLCAGLQRGGVFFSQCKRVE